MSRRRLLAGHVLALVLPTLGTAVLVPLSDAVNLVGDVQLFLLATVLVALVGGMLPALVSAVVGSLLLNFFLTPPRGTLAIDNPDDALALVVFVAVALLVSSVVELAARRGREAARAESLVEVDRTRTALLRAVGHDLRTPLAAAKAAVSTLRSDLPLTPADRTELTEATEESLDRLTALVEDLLDMSRLEAGATAVDLRPVSVDEVVSGVLDELEEAGDAVGVDLPDGLPAVVADPGLLRRVLVNLLRNATRFSPPGLPPSLGADTVAGVVELYVVDRGPGIATGDRERVFAPFQRLGDTDSTAGVGLGLALARGLAEAMGGTLEPRDTVGGGLTMVLGLPAAEAAADPAPGIRERAGEEVR